MVNIRIMITFCKMIIIIGIIASIIISIFIVAIYIISDKQVYRIVRIK